MTPMGWILFERIDWPASLPLFPASNDDWPFVAGLLLLGGLQWLLIGTILQVVVDWVCSLGKRRRG